MKLPQPKFVGIEVATFNGDPHFKPLRAPSLNYTPEEIEHYRRLFDAAPALFDALDCLLADVIKNQCTIRETSLLKAIAALGRVRR